MTVLPTFDMLLFGGTGDLVTRKLVPALYRRYVAGQVSAESRIFGVARTALLRTDYLAQTESACREFLGKEFDARHWTAFSSLLDYVRLDASAEGGYAALKTLLHGRDAFIRVFFFSTASNLFSVICQNLAKADVVTPLSRVVLEKPLGHDTESADLINSQVGAVFAEKQIYRIDHYLGKETVQNILVLRFGNGVFEPHVRSLTRFTLTDHAVIGDHGGLEACEQLHGGKRKEFDSVEKNHEHEDRET